MSGSIFSLEGKVAVITATGRSIGPAISEARAQACNAARSTPSLTNLLIQISGFSAPRHIESQQSGNNESINDTADQFVRKLGNIIRILVDGDGFENANPATDIDETPWDLIPDTVGPADTFSSGEVSSGFFAIPSKGATDPEEMDSMVIRIASPKIGCVSLAGIRRDGGVLPTMN